MTKRIFYGNWEGDLVAFRGSPWESGAEAFLMRDNVWHAVPYASVMQAGLLRPDEVPKGLPDLPAPQPRK